jgi:hypothetical protein
VPAAVDDRLHAAQAVIRNTKSLQIEELHHHRDGGTSITPDDKSPANESIMEPTGIEPVTSCLQSTSSRPRASALNIADLQGLPAAGLGAKIGADARGLSTIIVDSGTSREECLNDPAG